MGHSLGKLGQRVKPDVCSLGSGLEVSPWSASHMEQYVVVEASAT